MQNSLNSALFHKNLRLFLTVSEWFGWLINTGSTAQKKDFNYLCHHTQFLFFKYPGDDLHLFIKLITIASCPFFTSCVVMKACFWHTTNHILLTYIHIHHLCCIRVSALYSPKTVWGTCAGTPANTNSPCIFSFFFSSATRLLSHPEESSEVRAATPRECFALKVLLSRCKFEGGGEGGCEGEKKNKKREKILSLIMHSVRRRRAIYIFNY